MQTSSNMNPVQDVAQETIWEDTQMALPTASDVNTESLQPLPDFFEQWFQTAQNNMTSLSPSQATLVTNSLHGSLNFLTNTNSLSTMQAELDSYGVPIGSNLSSPTMTAPEDLPASKPVTLTMTGKLKPNIIIKVPRKTSSQSSKPKKISMDLG